MCYPIQKLQAWQELLIQTDMGEQKRLEAVSYGAQNGSGWRGAHSYQVFGMTGLAANQRQRHQVSLNTGIENRCKRKKRPSICYLVVQVPGRCFGKADLTPFNYMISKFSKTLSA